MHDYPLKRHRQVNADKDTDVTTESEKSIHKCSVRQKYQREEPATSSSHNKYSRLNGTPNDGTMVVKKVSNKKAGSSWLTGTYKNFLRQIDLITALLPAKVYRYICYVTYIFWFIMGILILRKTQNATAAVRYVKLHGHTVSEEVIANSEAFRDLLWYLDHEFTKPPAIFLLNQYALNMTFNFLCNTQDLPGVHDRLIFVTLDHVARDVLNDYWPRIKVVYLPIPSLYVSHFYFIYLFF